MVGRAYLAFRDRLTPLFSVQFADQMMQQRIQTNFQTPAAGKAGAANERLQEMNKKLPSWSLEPPYSFLK